MELIFRRDAYAARTGATVTAVDERGITLDRTVFYAMGAKSGWPRPSRATDRTP